MEILSFDGGAKASRKKKPLGLIFGVAIIAGVATLGSTLAATVTIGSSPITFGQGVVQAVACDNSITVTPTTSFVNAEGAGSFNLKTITIANLNNSATPAADGPGCAGKSLIVKAYGNTSDTPLTLFSGNTGITASINATIASTTASAGVTVSTATGSVTLSINSPTLSASDIFKIAIEQQN